MATAQIQHYLPRVMLSGFGTEDGRIWRFDRLEGVIKQIPIPVAGAEKNLYTVVDGDEESQALESELFSPIDGAFRPIVRRLEQGIQLGEREMIDLAFFVALLQVRVPEKIKQASVQLRHLDDLVG